MVGGKVIGMARGREDTLIHVQDNYPPNIPDTCSLRVMERRKDTGESVTIQIGDSIWWQCGEVMWTTAGTRTPWLYGGKSGIAYDIRLPKVGYSH